VRVAALHLSSLLLDKERRMSDPHWALHGAVESAQASQWIATPHHTKDTTMKITRRYGTTPQQRGSATGQSCPDVFGLDDGSYLIIGKTAQTWDMNNPVFQRMKELGASVGPDETAVIVPRDAIHAAALDIATEAGANGAIIITNFLSKTERAMLKFALDEAQELLWSRDGFTEEDQAALDRLRQLIREEAP
jgi:hypothetical protein